MTQTPAERGAEGRHHCPLGYVWRLLVGLQRSRGGVGLKVARAAGVHK